MLLKQCNKCGAIVPYGIKYCDSCKQAVDIMREESKQRSNKRYNNARDPKYKAFYKSAAWRQLSAKRLQDDHFRCAWCNGIATEVDHIKELSTEDGWKHRLDYDNVRSLCHDCHDKRHERFKYKKRKGSRT